MTEEKLRLEMVGKLVAENEKLRAERDRYREALEEIAGPCGWRELGSDCGTCEQCVANDALKAGKEGA